MYVYCIYNTSKILNNTPLLSWHRYIKFNASLSDRHIQSVYIDQTIKLTVKSINNIRYLHHLLSLSTLVCLRSIALYMHITAHSVSKAEYRAFIIRASLSRYVNSPGIDYDVVFTVSFWQREIIKRSQNIVCKWANVILRYIIYTWFLYRSVTHGWSRFSDYLLCFVV